MYGAGIPTERTYVLKLIPTSDYTLPFKFTHQRWWKQGPLLNGGVYSVDRDETVPVQSAGFMCAKGW